MASNEQPTDSFSLGRVFATPGALRAIEESGQSPADFLCRHARRDWGCVSSDDRRLNDDALECGARILSAYDTHLGVRLWIITEAECDDGQRINTTILLPQDY
ncbi:MAG: hypothetical protein ACYC6N_16715 [Pirellulaceae bacterium]